MHHIDHHIYVAGTGSCVPEMRMTNEILEKRITGFKEGEDPFGVWVDRVTHIHERRFLDPDGSSGDMARVACQRALECSGVDPAEIGLFIMASFTTKNLYPGEETKIVEELGLNKAAAFDLIAACAGSVYGLRVAHAFLKAGFCRHVLVVGTEHLTRVTDFSDPVTAILFGDGAGAVVLSKRDQPGPGGVVDACTLWSEYTPGNIMMDNTNVPYVRNVEILKGEDGAHEYTKRQYLSMAGGPRVLRVAVNVMVQAAVEDLGFTVKDLKQGNPELRKILDRIHIIPHQPNGRILDALRDKLQIPDEQLFKTIYHYGNISAASNVVTLDYAMRRGNMHRTVADDGRVSIEEDVGSPLKSGDLVSMPTVGAGYRIGCFTFVHEEFPR